MHQKGYLRKFIVYAIALACICAWAIFNLISYSISMYLATFLLALNNFLDAGLYREEGLKHKALARFVISLFLLACLAAILIFNP